jgi:hypothetical protein
MQVSKVGGKFSSLSPFLRKNGAINHHNHEKFKSVHSTNNYKQKEKESDVSLPTI